MIRGRTRTERDGRQHQIYSGESHDDERLPGRHPGQWQAFPDGSKIVKIEWAKKKNPVSPYFVEVPNTLASLAFIEKDSKRFPDTHGWAYAKWDYDAASGTFKLDALSLSGHKCGYTCHTAVKSTDYIFTAYPKR